MREWAVVLGMSLDSQGEFIRTATTCGIVKRGSLHYCLTELGLLNFENPAGKYALLPLED